LVSSRAREALLQLLRRRPLPDGPSLRRGCRTWPSCCREQWPAARRLAWLPGRTRRLSGGRRCCSCCAAVREIGRPATGTDIAEVTRDLALAELGRVLAAHGITNVGPPMEQKEAERHLVSFKGAQDELKIRRCGVTTE
jgi:hypothetical protein